MLLVTGSFAQESKDGVTINRRPMNDFAESAVNQIETGKVNLEAPFRVVVSGKLAPNNKNIVLADAKIESVTQPENSDPAMVKLVQDAIMAVGDAGWFAYIHNLGSKNVVITVEQTGDTFSASISADQPTGTRAKNLASSFGTMISVATSLARNDEKRSDDDRFLLSAMSVASEADKILIGLKLPKAQFQELVKRKIAESKAANTKVSGS